MKLEKKLMKWARANKEQVKAWRERDAAILARIEKAIKADEAKPARETQQFSNTEMVF
jgi:hypothetical protein